MMSNASTPIALISVTAAEVSRFMGAKRHAHGPGRSGGEDLNGSCAIASALLMIELRRQGLDAEVVVWSIPTQGHCYVECSGYLVDITAAQFGASDIEIHDLSAKPKERPYWRGRHRFRDVKSLQDYLLRFGWDEAEVPYHGDYAGLYGRGLAWRPGSQIRTAATNPSRAPEAFCVHRYSSLGRP
jgi:hypothetical protein